MAPTYLDEIVAHHRARAAHDHRPWRERAESTHYEGPSFRDALIATSNSRVNVIAEIKRRSPSKGWLNESLVSSTLALDYVAGGAAAISVLTDETYFAGTLDDLSGVRAAVSLPLLRKDFTVSENDVVDAASGGAGAVLLIVAALDDDELSRFLGVADSVGVDALVEVHDELEAKRAIDVGARLIGVNQRNLHTFHVDPALASSIVSWLPNECVSVCESGLATPADARRATEAGFNAVLVGEAFVTSRNPEEALRAFVDAAGPTHD